MIGAVSHVKSVTIADGTNTDIVRPGDWNSLHKGGLTISGQTAGASTWTGTNLVLKFSGDLTGSINGDTLVIDAPPKRSFWANLLQVHASNAIGASLSVRNSSSYVFPILVPYDLTVSFARMWNLVTVVSTSIGTTANTSYSNGVSYTWNVVIYSQGAGGSSKSLMSVLSGSCSFAQSVKGSHNAANGSQWSQTIALSYPYRGNDTNFTTQTSGSTSNFSVATSSVTQFNGVGVGRLIDCHLTGSLAAGAYWVCHGFSSASNGNNTALSGFRAFDTGNWIGMSNAVGAAGELGVSSGGSSANQGAIYAGRFTNNALTTEGIPVESISTVGGNPIPFFALHCSA